MQPSVPKQPKVGKGAGGPCPGRRDAGYLKYDFCLEVLMKASASCCRWRCAGLGSQAMLTCQCCSVNSTVRLSNPSHFYADLCIFFNPSDVLVSKYFSFFFEEENNLTQAVWVITVFSA